MISHGRKIIYGVLGAVILTGIMSGLVLYQVAHFDDTSVIFLDIGQGDAILITEGDHQILIDGGPDGRRLQELLGQYMPFWDRTIDVIIATHPDSDHIDGLVDLFRTYQVDSFWYTDVDKDTDVAEALLREVRRANTSMHTPTVGDTITFPSGASLRVIYPVNGDYPIEGDANAASITSIFRTGQEAFFLGGDLPKEIEDIVPLGDARITVLKAGHHGSHSSTSQAFLERIRPRDVIISAGAHNRYGHPHADVLTRSLRIGARIFRTDTEGSMIYTCDESCEISFKKTSK